MLNRLNVQRSKSIPSLSLFSFNLKSIPSNHFHLQQSTVSLERITCAMKDFKACLVEKVSDDLNVPCNQDDLVGFSNYMSPKAVVCIIFNSFK